MTEQSSTLESILQQEQRLQIEKSLALENAFKSNDVDQIMKANQYLKGIEKREDIDFKSIIVDPLDMTTALGYKQKPYNLSFDVLRAMGRAPIVKAIVETRKEQVMSFCEPQSNKYATGFVITKKKGYRVQQDQEVKLTKAEEAKVDELYSFIMNCGATGNYWSQDSFDVWVNKIMGDSLILDQMTSEIVRNRRGVPVNFFATDGATYRIADSYEQDDYTKGEKQISGYTPSYVQIYQNKVLAEFYPWELMFGVRNPQTDIRLNGYGKSELEDMIQTVTALLNADFYNANFFKVGSAPKGILRYSGNINPNTVEDFKRQWVAQVAGVQNCVSGDVNIITTEGQFSIESFFKESDETKVAKVWTGLSFEKANIYKTKTKKEFCTKLNNGLSIKTSSEHRFRTIDDEGNLIWKERGELGIGEFVLVNKKQISSEIKSSIQYKGQEVERDLFEILGWCLGDGTIGENVAKKRRIALFYNEKTEQDILSQHLSILEKYGINAQFTETIYSEEAKQRLKEKHGFKTVADRATQIQIFDIDFYNFVIELGFNPSRDSKVIPSSLFTLDSERKCALLRGLFSADGCNSGKRNIQLAISHLKLREDVRLLLLTEGIRTSAFEGYKSTTLKTHKGFTGMLLIKDRDLYFEKVGFIQDYKSENIGIKVANQGSMRSLPESLMIHYAKEIRFKNKQTKSLTERQRADINSIARGRDKCTIEKATRFMEYVEYPIPEWMKDYYIEPIIELTENSEEVQMYDVEIFDDIHQFVGNGMILHNSHKMPIINADKLDFINTQQSNKDMEWSRYQEFLIKITCAMYKIDPSEIGFPMSGSAESHPMFEGNNEARLQYSKDKGLKPLLKRLQFWINKYLISQIDPQYEFRFVGIEGEVDAQTELDNDIKGLSNFTTLNEIRAKRNLPLLPNGDVPLNPMYIQLMMSSMEGGEEGGGQQQEEDTQKAEENNPIMKALENDLEKLLCE